MDSVNEYAKHYTSRREVNDKKELYHVVIFPIYNCKIETIFTGGTR